LTSETGSKRELNGFCQPKGNQLAQDCEFDRNINMALTNEGWPDDGLGTRQFFVRRLREEGCDVEWQGSGDKEPVCRVITPSAALCGEKRNMIFRLVIGLAEVIQMPEFDLELQGQVLW
jgi:hypothetical protein